MASRLRLYNPGPFLTDFNDRGFETWKSWEDDPTDRLFDYSKISLPRAQFDPEPVYATMTAVAAGKIDTYRNLEPRSMLEETKRLIEAPWNKKVKDGLGTRPASLEKSYGARTRYYGGVTMSKGERASIPLYFMRQNDEFSRPFHKNAVGASVMFKFRSVHGRHPDE